MVFCINACQIPRISFMGSVNYETPWQHFKRQTDEVLIYIIKSGEMYLREDGKEYLLKEGDFFLLEPNLFHEGTRPASCEYYFLHLKNDNLLCGEPFSSADVWERILLNRNLSLASDPTSIKLYDNAYCYLPKYYSLQEPAGRMRVFQMLDDVVQGSKEKFENYKIYCSCKLLEIFMEVSKIYASSQFEREVSGYSSRTMKNIQSLMDFLNTEYGRKISGQEIEQRLGTNFDYINRIFRKLMGKTIFDYLNMIRINKAKELMGTTQLKFFEIAFQVGFRDEYYFSKTFKKYTGLSPSYYSKNMIHKNTR